MNAHSVPLNATLRVARPTDDVDSLLRFYRDGLGLNELGRFTDHDGFDGVMLGHPSSPYHFEFTHAHGHVVGRSTTQDHLIVFYIPDEKIWHGLQERMQQHGYDPVRSFNPYWDNSGVTFEDPDGYRVVLQNAEWNN